MNKIISNVADKDDELLMVLDENGNPTGRFEKRGVVHSKHLFHNEIALWIIDGVGYYCKNVVQIKNKILTNLPFVLGMLSEVKRY